MKSHGIKLLFLFFALSAHAWEVRDPVYLPAQLFDGSTAEQALAPMPQPGSTEQDADFTTLHHFQSTRTQAECERASYEVRLSLENEFGPKYGPLSEKEVKAWSPFLEKVAYETDYFVQKIKKHFHRPRPFQTDPTLKPCVKLETTGAYPSGHSTITRVFALVLDQMDPSRKAVFDARGNQIAEDRVLGGVHHPSDIEAGKKLGDEIFAELLKSEKFRQDLQVTKAQPTK